MTFMLETIEWFAVHFKSELNDHQQYSVEIHINYRIEEHVLNFKLIM